MSNDTIIFGRKNSINEPNITQLGLSDILDAYRYTELVGDGTIERLRFEFSPNKLVKPISHYRVTSIPKKYR